MSGDARSSPRYSLMRALPRAAVSASRPQGSSARSPPVPFHPIPTKSHRPRATCSIPVRATAPCAPLQRTHTRAIELTVVVARCVDDGLRQRQRHHGARICRHGELDVDALRRQRHGDEEAGAGWCVSRRRDMYDMPERAMRLQQRAGRGA
eukprot:scaffold6789_cov115-Isochrysis_galbana.AAC.7